MGIQRKATVGKLNHTILGINLTHRCNLRCPGCAAAIWQAPEKKDIDEETLDKLIDETKATGWKWHTIKVTGGEPTLHPHLVRFVKKLRAAFGKDVIYRLCTNRASEVRKKLKGQMPWIRLIGRDKKGQPTRHFPAFLAPCDDDRRARDFTEGCFRLKQCGIAYGLNGKYYPCAICTHIDRVFNLGLGCDSLAELVKVDENMVLEEYCSRCGMFAFPYFARSNTAKYGPSLKILGLVANAVSPTWAKAFQDYARRKGQPCGIMLPGQPNQ